MLASRKVKLAALAAGMTLLAGCGMHPGAAAVVGSETITQQQVDDVAEAVCSANVATAQAQGQAIQGLPARGAREVALQILLETELSQQFGEHEGVEADQQKVAQALAQNETGINMLPADQRDDFRNALRNYAEGQLMLIEIGRKSLGGDVSDDQAIAEGTRLRKQYVDSLDVEVDPRYGSFEKGAFKRGGDQLSVAASEQARRGDKAQPDATFVSELPASQRCR